MSALASTYVASALATPVLVERLRGGTTHRFRLEALDARHVVLGGRSRSTFGGSDVASGRGDAGTPPTPTDASRPPGRSTAKLRVVTSPPTVSNTASRFFTRLVKSSVR